jgi:hypothetical protein
LNFDVLEVTGVAGLTLTLGGPVTRGYPAGAQVWPLLFGSFKMDDQETAETSWHGEVKVSIQELTARGQEPVGNVPAAPGPGVGGWRVGTTFVVS